MTKAIHFEHVEHAVLSTQHDYQAVFEFCKSALISIGGNIKKEDVQAGTLEVAWKYGINPFGLRGNLIFRTLDDGSISITVKAGFKDSVYSGGVTEKKVQEIIQALTQEDVKSSISPPAFSDAPVNPKRNKTKLGMGLMSFFIGGFGVHKFYSGCWGWGLVYLASSFVLPGVSAVIAIIECIRILTLSSNSFDEKYNLSAPKPFTFIW